MDAGANGAYARAGEIFREMPYGTFQVPQELLEINLQESSGQLE